MKGNRKHIVAADRAAIAMKKGACLARMHVGNDMRWYIVPGHQVSDDVAKILLAREDCLPAEDGLFPGISQTYRIR
jgi:hypothetical protein